MDDIPAPVDLTNAIAARAAFLLPGWNTCHYIWGDRLDLLETDILGDDIANHWYFASKAKFMIGL